MATATVSHIKELTTQCKGIPKLLVDVILDWIQHMSIEPCKPPEEPDVDMEECLIRYQTLAYQFLDISIMPTGSER